MNQEDITKEIQLYNQQLISLQREIVRIEGVLLYLQSKLKNTTTSEKEV